MGASSDKSDKSDKSDDSDTSTPSATYWGSDSSDLSALSDKVPLLRHLDKGLWALANSWRPLGAVVT